MLFGISCSFAQKKKEADSIIKSISGIIYENPEKAIRVGKEILNHPESSVTTKINSLILISDAYSSKRDYQKALKYFLQANELSRHIDYKYLKVRILNKTAIKYQQLKVYDKAIHYLDEATKLIGTNPDTDSLRLSLGINYVVRGFIYKEQLSCDIAIGYFNKGIETCKTIKTIGMQPTISIATYNRGNCYTLLSNYDAAKQSFKESIQYADSINAHSLKAFAQKGLAAVYTLEGNYTQAITLLEEALEISKNVGDLILNREIYKGLSDNYLAVNNWQDYQLYHKKYVQLQLKIKESERASISESIEEVSQLNHQKTVQARTYFYYAGLVIISLAILMTILLFIYHTRSRKSLQFLNDLVENMKKEGGIAKFKK